MDEYIKREAAIKAIYESDPNGIRRTLGFNVGQIEEALRAVPAVDLAPVVRCKNCEYAERYKRADGVTGYCCGYPQNIFTYGERWNRVFKVKEANDFCSYGERKTDAGEPTGA